MSDARFWLSKLNGDVQIVMTIEISRSSPNVVFDLWKLVNDRVECQQVVMINGQPLVIRFDKLFLRPPTIPKETNISIGNAIIDNIAIEVWEEQGF